MKRHVIEDTFQKHRGQQYGGSFGRSFESERDTGRSFDRDINGRFSPKADWNNDLNQNGSAPGVRNGNYGKGPKNYRRSDDRIRDLACEALANDPEVDASEIEVKVRDGIISLDGKVPSRAMKRAAEYIVEDFDWVLDVQNRLEILTEKSS